MKIWVILGCMVGAVPMLSGCNRASYAASEAPLATSGEARADDRIIAPPRRTAVYARVYTRNGTSLGVHTATEYGPAVLTLDTPNITNGWLVHPYPVVYFADSDCRGAAYFDERPNRLAYDVSNYLLVTYPAGVLYQFGSTITARVSYRSYSTAEGRTCNNLTGDIVSGFNLTDSSFRLVPNDTFPLRISSN